MDLALPALVFLVLATPGFAFLRAYQRGLEGLPVKPRSFGEEVAIGLLVSIMLHVIWFALSAPLRWWLSLEFDHVALGRLLTGEYGKDGKELGPTVSSVYLHAPALVAHFASLIAVSVALGFGAHRWVATHRRLRAVWPLAFNDEWHRLLTSGRFTRAGATQAESNVFAEISAIVPTGQGDYLYRGILPGPKQIIFNAEGDIDRFVLVAVARRKLEQDETAGDGDSRFYAVKGDLFVLRYAETKTLNVNFLALAEETGSTDAALEPADPAQPGSS